ncbi:tumor necrosis factor receptor superfamily member 10A-like isoform X2 [Narcine bancroftii]|uniref:tumor necrosis factor receptor superfamily member 10A-like isoform X2 n=1 Tax=Narcine bancroftii TaxID=1343680 RepID=UPI0038322AF6
MGSSRLLRSAFLVLVLFAFRVKATLGNAVNSTAMKRDGKAEVHVSLVLRSSREVICSTDDYYRDGSQRCCRKCPAGTHVAEHCLRNNGRAKCKVCVKGEEYTSWDNGLEECLTCTTCREDQQQVSPCTVINNTKCQCRPGTFCTPGEICEVCHKCKSCPEGQVVKNCTPASNTVCGKTEAEVNSTPLKELLLKAVIPLFLISLFIIGLWSFFRKKPCEVLQRRCENGVRQGISCVMTQERPLVMGMRTGMAFDNSNHQTAPTEEPLLQNNPAASTEHRAGSFTNGLQRDQIVAMLRNPGDDPLVKQSAHLQAKENPLGSGIREGAAFDNSSRQMFPDKEQAQTEKEPLLQSIPEAAALHRAGSFKDPCYGQAVAVPRDLGNTTLVEPSGLTYPGASAMDSLHNCGTRSVHRASPSAPCVEKVTDKHPCTTNESKDIEDLKQSFYFFIKEVPLKKWKELMRKLFLTENEIEAAEQNNCKNFAEAQYQMLNTWLQKTGKDASITTLLTKLKEMNLNEAAEKVKQQCRTSSEQSTSEMITSRNGLFPSYNFNVF